MSLRATHKFVSAIPDKSDASLLRPSDWNDLHNIEGFSDGTEPPANPTVGDLWLDPNGYMAYTVAVGSITDITSATSDVKIPAGSTVYIDYSSATSVPLHIATEEGEYEISISGFQTNVVATNDNLVILNPNNSTGYSIGHYGTTLRSDGTGTNIAFTRSTGFRIGKGQLVKAECKVSTFTKTKNISSRSSVQFVSTYSAYEDVSHVWEPASANNIGYNYTTPWTSLGTIVFPFVQSGKIVIKRII